MNHLWTSFDVTNSLVLHSLFSMLGVGRNLQTPCLQPDQLLNRSRISQLFAQKNIWVKPVENIQDIDQCLITDMLPVRIFMNYPQKWVTNVWRRVSPNVKVTGGIPSHQPKF